MGLEERDASELETGQRVSISGSEGQGRPNAFGLVFGCWLGQEFNEPFAASGRIEANGGQFVLGVGGFAGFGDLAGEVRRPFGSDEFFGNGTAFFDGGQVRREDAINVLGAHPEGVVALKQPVSRREAADDDDVGMHVRRDGGGDFGEHLAW